MRRDTEKVQKSKSLSAAMGNPESSNRITKRSQSHDGYFRKHTPAAENIDLNYARYKKGFNKVYKGDQEHIFDRITASIEMHKDASNKFWEQSDPDGSTIDRLKNLRSLREKCEKGQVSEQFMESAYEALTDTNTYQESDEKGYQDLMSGMKQMQKEEKFARTASENLSNPGGISRRSKKKNRELNEEEKLESDVEFAQDIFFNFKYKDKQPQQEGYSVVVMSQDVPGLAQERDGGEVGLDMLSSMKEVEVSNGIGATIVWPESEKEGAALDLYQTRRGDRRGIDFGLVLDPTKVGFVEGGMFEDGKLHSRVNASNGTSLDEFAADSWKGYHKVTHKRESRDVRQSSQVILDVKSEDLGGAVKSVMINLSESKNRLTDTDAKKILSYLEDNSHVGISMYDSQSNDLREYDGEQARDLLGAIREDIRREYDSDRTADLNFKYIDNLDVKRLSAWHKGVREGEFLDEKKRQDEEQIREEQIAAAIDEEHRASHSVRRSRSLVDANVEGLRGKQDSSKSRADLTHFSAKTPQEKKAWSKKAQKLNPGMSKEWAEENLAFQEGKAQKNELAQKGLDKEFWDELDPQGEVSGYLKNLRSRREHHPPGQPVTDSDYKVTRLTVNNYQEGDDILHGKMVSALLQLKKESERHGDQRATDELQQDVQFLQDSFFKYKTNDRVPEEESVKDHAHLVIMQADIPKTEELKGDHLAQILNPEYNPEVAKNAQGSFDANLIWSGDVGQSTPLDLSKTKKRQLDGGVSFGIVMDQDKLRFMQGHSTYTESSGKISLLGSNSSSLPQFAQESWSRYQKSEIHQLQDPNDIKIEANKAEIDTKDGVGFTDAISSILIDMSAYQRIDSAEVRMLSGYLKDHPDQNLSIYDNNDPEGEFLKELDSETALEFLGGLGERINHSTQHVSHRGNRDTVITTKEVNKFLESQQSKDNAQSDKEPVPQADPQEESHIERRHSLPNDLDDVQVGDWAAKGSKEESPTLSVFEQELANLGTASSFGPDFAAELSDVFADLGNAQNNLENGGSRSGFATPPASPPPGQKEVDAITSDIAAEKSAREAGSRRSLPTPPASRPASPSDTLPDDKVQGRPRRQLPPTPPPSQPVSRTNSSSQAPNPAQQSRPMTPPAEVTQESKPKRSLPAIPDKSWTKKVGGKGASNNLQDILSKGRGGRQESTEAGHPTL